MLDVALGGLGVLLVDDSKNEAYPYSIVPVIALLHSDEL
jgi:hypothetical protein